MSKVYLEQVQKARMLAEGLKRHLEEIKPWGINESEIQQLEQLAAETDRLNSEVEAMRATTNAKVSEATRMLARLKEQLGHTKPVIKRSVEPERWSDFGIPDKR